MIMPVSDTRTTDRHTGPITSAFSPMIKSQIQLNQQSAFNYNVDHDLEQENDEEGDSEGLHSYEQ